MLRLGVWPLLLLRIVAKHGLLALILALAHLVAQPEEAAHKKLIPSAHPHVYHTNG